MRETTQRTIGDGNVKARGLVGIGARGALEPSKGGGGGSAILLIIPPPICSPQDTSTEGA